MKLTPTSLPVNSSEDTLLAAAAVQPLPRAVSRPNPSWLLDGEWRFALDPDDRGLSEGWFFGHTYVHTAQWPGTVETHMDQNPPSNDVPLTSQTVAWYEREFVLPAPNGSIKPSLYQLTFGACGYETRVWLNGQSLHTIEGEEVHNGEYTSFSYELEPDWLQPVNRLTVRIADTLDADLPRGKQESHVYKRGGIWYQTYTGATRSIWLEEVERNRLRSRVGVVSVIEAGLVHITLTTRIHDPGTYQLQLQVYRTDPSERLPLVEEAVTLHLETGQSAQSIALTVPEARLWSPDDPYCYRLVAHLIDETTYVARIESMFGLREIKARGQTIYLNNEPVYLDGILYQPGVATYEQMSRHLRAMKALGCNLVRVHIAGIDPRMYYLADQIGMMLWIEVPSPHQSSVQSRRNHRAELLRMLALVESHPSVVIWSLYNEVWGIQDIATNPAVRRYVTKMYQYMSLHHPQFLIVDNDGWQHVSVNGRLMSDLLTAHLYTPDPDHWRWLLDRLVAGQTEGVAAFPLVVGDPYFYRQQVPLLVSEWGGFGFANYGGPDDSIGRTERIRLFKQELRRRGIAGDVYTQATDIEDERNGLFDAQTNELWVPEGLLASETL